MKQIFYPGLLGDDDLLNENYYKKLGENMFVHIFDLCIWFITKD